MAFGGGTRLPREPANMKCRKLVAGVLLAAGAGIAAFGVAWAQPISPATAGPPGLAFYVPPSPLPPGRPGHAIWSRPLTGAGVLKSAAVNTLVLYQTTSVGEQDTAVSGTIAIPKGSPPPGGWPIVSWAHGTTGNAPQCAPSRADEPNEEQIYLDAWVARGYAVVQTDYEGQGTPGLHPYFVGTAAARDTIDIVRAARQLYPQIGTNWFAFGHSEGGSAAIFTAFLANEWAPELHLMGAVSFAPASHIGSAIAGLSRYPVATPFLPFMLEMIEGVASADRTIDVRDLLTPEAFARLPDLQKRCIDDLSDDTKYTSLLLSNIFRQGADLTPLLRDFAVNEDDHLHVAVPLLLVQGDADTIVVPADTASLARELCANGSRITFVKLPGLDHGTVMNGSLDRTKAWVDAVVAGNPPASTCT
jgi:pimeloyl-ACP methyl ester carboxylesterase